jgi:hypothetical protein
MTGMAASYFVAHDYDLAFNLQNLFYEHVNLYTKLHYPDSKDELFNKERRELNIELRKSSIQMSLLVLKMKELKSDSGLESCIKQHSVRVENQRADYRSIN